MPDSAASVRLYAYLARDARRAVVLRRGPSKQVLMIAWNLADDTFEVGQWLKGHVYERRCDVSPNGEHFLYFAAKWKGPIESGTAVSRPPWFTPVALWPKGDATGGGGLFDDDRTVRLNHGVAEPALAPGHALPPGTAVAQFGEPGAALGEDDPLWTARLARDGWKLVSHETAREAKADGKTWLEFDPPRVYEKPRPTAPKTLLRMTLRGVHEQDGAYYVAEHAVVTPSRILPLGRAEWADWDRTGDLLYARDGRLYRLDPSRADQGRVLINFSDEAFAERATPAAMTTWGSQATLPAPIKPAKPGKK